MKLVIEWYETRRKNGMKLVDSVKVPNLTDPNSKEDYGLHAINEGRGSGQPA